MNITILQPRELLHVNSFCFESMMGQCQQQQQQQGSVRLHMPTTSSSSRSSQSSPLASSSSSSSSFSCSTVSYSGKPEEKLAKQEMQEEKKAEEQKQSPYEKDIVPLCAAVLNMLAIVATIPISKGPDDDGPIAGFKAMFWALIELYFFSDDPEWLALRDKLSLGLVKDTKKHGNTSVSMGAAKKYEPGISRDISSIKKYAGFLNCGTGGVKHQLYCLENGILFLVDEYKPKEGEAASPNALPVVELDYNPKNPMPMKQNQGLLKIGIVHFATHVVPKGVQCPVYALITGPLRELWEKGDARVKRILEELAVAFYSCVPGIKPLPGKTFFMPQADEGELELSGTQQMYTNLVNCDLLDGVFVIGSFGIGRGSCQWMVECIDGSYELTGHNAGMTDESRLAGLGSVIVKGYKEQPDKFTRFKFALKRALAEGKLPVIALKSGCSLLFEKDPKVKAAFSTVSEEAKRRLLAPLPRFNDMLPTAPNSSGPTPMFYWGVSEPLRDPKPISPFGLRRKLILAHSYLCERYLAPGSRKAFDAFIGTLSQEENGKIIRAMYSGLETLSLIHALRTNPAAVAYAPDIPQLLDQTYVSVGKEQKFEDGTTRTTSLMTGVAINAVQRQPKQSIMGAKFTNDKIEVTLMRNHKENGVVEVRTEEVKVCFSNLRMGNAQKPLKASDEISVDFIAQRFSECLQKFTEEERKDALTLVAITGVSGDTFEKHRILASGTSEDHLPLELRTPEFQKRKIQAQGQADVDEMISWARKLLVEHPLLKNYGIKPWSLTGDSFYMLSEEASWLETVATTFHNKHLFPEGRTVLVMDTNKTQARLWFNQAGGKAKSLIHPHGLENANAQYLYDPTGSTTTSLKGTVKTFLEEDNATNVQSFCDVLRETIKAGFKPVIALKSGQALLFNKQPKALELLFDA